jgi:hypothetical protein
MLSSEERLFPQPANDQGDKFLREVPVLQKELGGRTAVTRKNFYWKISSPLRQKHETERKGLSEVPRQSRGFFQEAHYSLEIKYERGTLRSPLRILHRRGHRFYGEPLILYRSQLTRPWKPLLPTFQRSWHLKPLRPRHAFCCPSRLKTVPAPSIDQDGQETE